MYSKYVFVCVRLNHYLFFNKSIQFGIYNLYQMIFGYPTQVYKIDRRRMNLHYLQSIIYLKTSCNKDPVFNSVKISNWFTISCYNGRLTISFVDEVYPLLSPLQSRLNRYNQYVISSSFYCQDGDTHIALL